MGFRTAIVFPQRYKDFRILIAAVVWKNRNATKKM